MPKPGGSDTLRDIPEMLCVPELVIADVSTEIAERQRAFEGR